MSRIDEEQATAILKVLDELALGGGPVSHLD
jgi:hypothetical protein